MFLRGEEAAQTYVPPRMNEWQMRALEDRIRHSKDATPFGKRVIIWLLRQTDGLTKPVALSMPAHFCGGSAREVQNSAHDMLSTNGTTHLTQCVILRQTEMGLEHHSGRYRQPGEQLPIDRLVGDPKSGFGHFDDGARTIWWSLFYYDHGAARLALPTIEELAAIEVE